MALITPTFWDPFDAWNTGLDFTGIQPPLRRIQRDLERTLPSYIEGYPLNYGNPPTKESFRPAADIVETDKEYLILVNLPGLSKDQVKVETHENKLLLSGEFKNEVSESEGTESIRSHLKERFIGKVHREITLPKNSDLQHVRASMEQGVLRLVVPKIEPIQAETRIIPIS